MSLGNVHIKPVAPDPNTSERYGSSGDRARPDRPPPSEQEQQKTDRLEISDDARASFLLNAVPPDIDFARKALYKLPAPPDEREEQLAARIASGYYQSPVIVRQVAARLIPA